MASLKINLLPPEIRKRRKMEQTVVFLILGFFVFLALLTTFTLGLSFKASQEETKLRGLEAKTAKFESQIKKYQVFRERKEEVNKHKEALAKAIRKEISWYKLLNEVSMIVPSEVWLEKIEVDEEGITFKGFTYQQPSVAKFMVRLSDLEYLSDLWLEESQAEEIEFESDIPQYQLKGTNSNKAWALKFEISGKLPTSKKEESSQGVNSQGESN